MHFNSNPAVRVEYCANFPVIFIIVMKILGAVGLGIAIIVLKLLMGNVFHAFENTLLSLFDFSQHMITNADHAVSRMDAQSFGPFIR